jgi:amino acid adenylation domain-containing protein
MAQDEFGVDRALWTAAPEAMPQQDHSSVSLQSQAELWRRTLADAPMLLSLPTDRRRPAQRSLTDASVPVRIDAALKQDLQQLSRRHDATLFITVLAAWAALLGRLSGQDDLVIGTPAADRKRPQIEGLVGLLANTLALRIDLSGQPSVGELLARVHGTTQAPQDHQDPSFEQPVEIGQPPQRRDHTPPFQVMFAWRHEQDADDGARLVGERSDLAADQVRFDLELTLSEAGGEIVGTLAYATALFDRSTIERHVGYLDKLLRAMVAAPDQVVGRLDMLSAAERHQVLHGWNDTAVPLATDLCIHQLFEAQAARTPDAIAVVYEDRQLSYGELNARANRLAHRLIGLGVKPDDRVAICVERSIEMVVGLLAVLKAGVGYVPLDPAYPSERLQFMLEDSTPVAVLSQSHLRSVLPDHGPAAILMLDAKEADRHQYADINPVPAELGLTSANLAYVIYTSGSTGTPKGVMIEHRQTVNFLLWGTASFRPDDLARTLSSTSLNFDLAVFECFLPLCVGAIVRIVRDILDLTRRPVDVTLINTVPSAMDALLQAGKVSPTTRIVNVAGEPLPQRLVERVFLRTQVDAVNNLYGPSETTTYSTFVTMRRGEPFAAHVGRPIANTRVYLLDQYGAPVPMGVAGEIHIGGVGVARGYLNRPELTAERFIRDPFAPQGGRMYRTGDLGRYLPDGNIEFLGRNDFQVKIRGFRIELGEIEARLAEHPAVRETVVLAREDAPDGRRLVAYYTTRPGAAAPGALALRAHLAASLPEYMVPAAYVALESMPLNANGKLDRKTLPAPTSDAFALRGYEPLRGETEEKLAQFWAEALKLDRVGREDNFFDLGGHSLLAMDLASRINASFKTSLPLSTVFHAPTIATLAEVLEQQRSLSGIPWFPTNRRAQDPLCFA